MNTNHFSWRKIEFGCSDKGGEKEESPVPTSFWSQAASLFAPSRNPFLIGPPFAAPLSLFSPTCGEQLSLFGSDTPKQAI